MEVIVKVKYGSHLYGTSTAESDSDVKGIYLPSTQEILLQRVLPVIAQGKLRDSGKKNTKSDIDSDLYSLQKYLQLLSEGQPVALEMLFAPKEALLTPLHPVWIALKKLAPHLLTKKTMAFVNYCRQQAHKYGKKGVRLAAVRKALERLEKLKQQYGSSTKLNCVQNVLQDLADSSDYISIGKEMILANGSKVDYFEICGKKIISTISLKSARLVLQNILNEYAQRTMEAEKHGGADWKALSHAVRIGHQAIEFFSTHTITFPRPEAAHLLAIKLGQLPLEQVEQEIENLFVEVERAMHLSRLPSELDNRLIERFIMEAYLKQILKENRHAAF